MGHFSCSDVDSEAWYSLLWGHFSYSEGDNETWYYSTPLQLDEVIDALDPQQWEPDLTMALEDLKDDFYRHMAITEELTNSNRGSKKSAIDEEKGAYEYTDWEVWCNIQQ